MTSAVGRHRAPRPRHTTRRLVSRVSATGATLALPVIGAGTASALDGDSDTYTVSSGDTLSTIAEEQGIEGGWQKLYEDNRSVIGDDPDLLSIGQKLSLDGAGDTGTSTGDNSTGTTTGTQASYSSSTEETAPSAVLPVSGGILTAGFQDSGDIWSNGHTGQDFAVPTGTTVRAATGGTVVSAGWDNAFGYEVVIKHDDGEYTQYAHLSQIDVSPGATVGTGDRIALSGATGNVTGPHLHFEVRTTPDYGSAVDPLDWLRDRGVET
ncbi:M23 family metallopeptidase [Streptomyces sp. 7N604]|uniref:M23 family metallopeptidase n=1 Tax=Streptomyces sp. 7N604 TaxID=3457415 RepID=UPI003FCF366C